MTKPWWLALLQCGRPLIASMALESPGFDRLSCALRTPAAVPKLLVHRISQSNTKYFVISEAENFANILKINIQKQEK
jgi:hypothetical protein